jgi:hypothetical protein
MEQDLMNYGQQNFNLPHDIIQLPSGGLYYNSKKKAVKVGYLTATDENILANIDGKKSIKEGVIVPLLRNKLYEPDLRPEELLEGDAEAILLFLRNTSFGPEYKLSLVDPKTNQQFEASIMLDELNIVQPKVQPDENGLFETKLPMSGSIVKLKLLSLMDSIAIDNIVDKYPKGYTAPIITTRLNKMVVEVDGNQNKEEISKFCQNMLIGDSKHIRKFMNENEPRLDLKRKVIAPSGEEVDVQIAFGVEFFRPFF